MYKNVFKVQKITIWEKLGKTWENLGQLFVDFQRVTEVNGKVAGIFGSEMGKSRTVFQPRINLESKKKVNHK